MTKRCVAYVMSSILLAQAPALAFADDKPKTADEWAEDGFALVSKGDFANAIAAYMKAFQISADGRALYNVAAIYDRKLHEREIAADYYRRYLRLPQTEPDLVVKANERLAALKEEEEAIRRNATAPARTAAPAAQNATTAPKTEAAPTDSTRTVMRTAGFLSGGVGIALLGVGTWAGLTAKSKNDEASALCKGDVCANARAISLTDEATSAATISTITFVAGGTLVAAGIGLLILAPKERTSALYVIPTAGVGSAGVNLGGVFQ